MSMSTLPFFMVVVLFELVSLVLPLFSESTDGRLDMLPAALPLPNFSDTYRNRVLAKYK